MQSCFKLARGFSIGDTGTGSAGNCTTGTIGSNNQTAAFATAVVAGYLIYIFKYWFYCNMM